MKTKLLILSTFIVSIVLLAAVSLNAKVYINNFPQDITVNEGMPVDVPLFFAGGEFTGQPVEIYVIKRDHDDAAMVEYFDLSTYSWIPITDGSQAIKPMAKIDQMIEYAYLVWEAIENSTGVNPFDLYVCMDGNIDGQYQTETCSVRLVDIIKSPPQDPSVCTGLTLNPASITQTLERGKSLTVTINVNDSCGPADFTATTSSSSWISVPAAGKGVLNVTLNSSSLAVGKHEGDISVSSAGGSSQTLKVILTVTPPVIDLGGGCTGSSITVWPVSISSATGETKTATTNVLNNCGKALPYTASVISGSGWLSVQKSGTGALTVTTNASGLNAGTQNGTIRVSSSGYPDATLNASLTVTGLCVVNKAVISPSAISKSAAPGVSIANVAVSVKDNCGNNLQITKIDENLSWLTVTDNQNGSLTVSFDETQLLTPKTYTGSIILTHSYGSTTIPVTVTISSISADVTSLTNGVNLYKSYDPGQVRYFSLNVNSDKDPKNDSPLQVEMMDMTQGSGLYNVDMIVKYAGATCETSEKPTESDYQFCKNKWNCKGENGLYSGFNKTSFDSVIISNNPVGCYYIWMKNVDSVKESSISIKWADSDSS